MRARPHLRYVGPAWALLIVVRVMLWTVPYRRVLAVTERAARVRATRSALPPRTAAHAIDSAARFVPSATCLVRALAGRVLLAHLGYDSRVCLGVRREGRALEAHAWLECEGDVVIGEHDRQDFTPLAP